MRLLLVSYMVLAAAAVPAGAQPTPSAEPVQGPTEGNSPAAPAARSASPGGETDAGQPAPSSPDEGRLLGDVGGLRTRLDSAGLSLGLLEQSEVLGNVTGGIHRGAVYEGVTSLGLGLDFEKAFGWAGGTFNVTAFQYHGRGLTEYNLPALTGVTGIEQTARGARLFELWYEQLLLDKKVAIRIGQLSADQEFMTTEYGGLFVNAGYGFPTLASSDLPSGGVDYPLATPGIRLKVVPDEQWAGLLAVFNGDPAGRGPGDPEKRDGGGTSFRFNDGAFVIGEVQYGLNQGSNAKGLPGTYKLGMWYQSEAFADPRFSLTGLSLADPANTAAARMRQGDYSLYGTVDQLVWKKPGTSDGGVAVFTRVLVAPPDRNLVDAFVQGGITDKSPFPGRDNDTVGVAATWSHISSHASKFASDQVAFTGHGVPERHAEIQTEADYQAQFAPWVQVQPFLQYILHPGGGILDTATGRRVGDALVLGLRTNVTF